MRSLGGSPAERAAIRYRLVGEVLLAGRVEADAVALVPERVPALSTMVCQPPFLQLAPVARVSVMTTLSMAGPNAPARGAGEGERGLGARRLERVGLGRPLHVVRRCCPSGGVEAVRVSVRPWRARSWSCRRAGVAVRELLACPGCRTLRTVTTYVAVELRRRRSGSIPPVPEAVEVEARGAVGGLPVGLSSVVDVRAGDGPAVDGRGRRSVTTSPVGTEPVSKLPLSKSGRRESRSPRGPPWPARAPGDAQN